MDSQLTTTIISTIAGAISGCIVSFLLDRRREKREDKKEQQKALKEAYVNSPELEITEYKDYINRPGYGLKQACDIDISLIPIDNVNITDSSVSVEFNTDTLDKSNYCCVIYKLTNIGKTDIVNVRVVSHRQKSTVLYPSHSLEVFAESGCLNYYDILDKKIHTEESISLKICYNKDKIPASLISAATSIVFEDRNGNYWEQSLFSPENKIYTPRKISYKDFKRDISIDIAEECFRKPWLW